MQISHTQRFWMSRIYTHIILVLTTIILITALIVTFNTSKEFDRKHRELKGYEAPRRIEKVSTPRRFESALKMKTTAAVPAYRNENIKSDDTNEIESNGQIGSTCLAVNKPIDSCQESQAEPLKEVINIPEAVNNHKDIDDDKHHVQRDNNSQDLAEVVKSELDLRMPNIVPELDSSDITSQEKSYEKPADKVISESFNEGEKDESDEKAEKKEIEEKSKVADKQEKQEKAEIEEKEEKEVKEEKEMKEEKVKAEKEVKEEQEEQEVKEYKEEKTGEEDKPDDSINGNTNDEGAGKCKTSGVGSKPVDHVEAEVTETKNENLDNTPILISNTDSETLIILNTDENKSGDGDNSEQKETDEENHTDEENGVADNSENEASDVDSKNDDVEGSDDDDLQGSLSTEEKQSLIDWALSFF